MSKSTRGNRHRQPNQLLGRLIRVVTLAPVAAASTTALPGLADIKLAIKTISSRLQSSAFERSRCSALAFKMRLISGMIDEMELLELDCVHDISMEILDIERDIDTALTSKPWTFRRADHVLDALDHLEQRANSVVALVQMKLQLRSSITADYKQLEVVKSHEITDQVIVPFERLVRYPRYMVEHRETLSRGNVAESRRFGLVNGAPVIYIRYSAARASDAEKLAKARIDWHRRCLHLNVASVLGVTTGTRLDGVILATGGLTLKEFWRRADSPRAVAECIKGILTIPSGVSLEPGDRYRRRAWLYMEMAHVDMNGHITFTLTDNQEHQEFLSPLEYIYTGTKYEWVNLALITCSNAKYGDGYDSVSNFLNGMARLTASLTELSTLRLVETTGVPAPHKQAWCTQRSAPPVAVLPGDVGRFNHDFELKADIMDMVELSSFSGGSKTEWLLEPSRLRPAATSFGSDWTTQVLPCSPSAASFEVFHDEMDYRQLSWKARAQFWEQTLRVVSKSNLESLGVCTHILYRIRIIHKGGAIITMRYPFHRVTMLYHHRRPLARSNPRDYWGYLSFSSNPEDRDSDLERNGWILQHKVYRRMLKRGMDKMPGGFPSNEPQDDLDWLFDDGD
ncbi:hypothetical protein RhiJN_26476 [Ceratobasidium sp. AG-Ba]|nr:hypothetical protein RhiJN_26476 [Ceratobasidium sp. AG-Ba]